MVKEGYKHTEIGMIPEDWECVKIKDVATIRMCKRIFVDQTIENGEVPFYKIGTFGKEPDAYISMALYNEYKQRFSFPEKGDVLISASGTLGRTVVFDGRDAYFQDSNIVWLNIDKKMVCNEYLNHYYRVIRWASSEGSTIARLYNGIIYQTDIALPPIDEQKHIAEALSDVDDMIVSLEKLIEKKKTIKQGAMQDLLTGKKRLPGFKGQWNIINLSKKSKIKARIGWQGLTINEYLDDGYAYLVTGTDFVNGKIDWDGCHYVAKDRFDQDKNIQIRNNDVLITKDGSLGKTALVKGLNKPATLNSGVFLIKPIQEAYDPSFVYYILSSFVFKDFLDHLSAGSTIIHLYQKDINKFEFFVPPTVEEQTAIASVLSDMDSEIEELEQKLNKTRQLKQGMMQQLLTGKIRLVEEDTAIEPVRTQNNSAKTQTGHNHQFDDAVMIAAIVNAFYTEKYPLGRKKVQKLLYLLRRKQEVDTSAFKKKAAGPYADEVRYKGGEPIAKSKGYISFSTSKKGTSFSKGENIDVALSYVERWNKQAEIDWLLSTFKYVSVNDLELYATIDMAICDLKQQGVEVTVDSVKKLIRSNDVWKAKLKKSYFSDTDIARAIYMSKQLFSH